MAVNYGNIQSVDLSSMASGLAAQLDAKRKEDEQKRLQQQLFAYKQQQDTIENKVKQDADARAQAESAAKVSKETEDSQNALLGKHAQIMAALPQEQQEDYYQSKVVPLLTQGQTGQVSVPEASNAVPVLNAISQSPAERITARKTDKTPINYKLGPYGPNGELTYMPSEPTPAMQQGPNGSFYSGVTPPKPLPKPLQPKVIPTKVKEGISGNMESLSKVQQAIAMLNTPGVEPNSTLGALAGNFGNKAYAAASSPSDVKARALLGNIGDVAIYDITGAASAARQDERYQKWIPKLGVFGDNNETALAKLRLMEDHLTRNISRASKQYAPSAGYMPDPLITEQGGQSPSSPESSIPTYKEYDSLPKGSRFMDDKGNIREKR